jgi:outer membrane protein
MLKSTKSKTGKHWALPILAVIALFVSAAHAQQVVRIGFIDPVRLIEQAPQGGRALEQLEIEFQPSNESLMKQHNRVQEMEAELERNILVISASDAQVRQREIDNLKRRLKRSQQEAREDYNLRRNEEIGKLQALVREIVVELAKEQGYDLIIEQAVYVSDAVNLTDQVLGRLAQLP